MSTCTLKPGEVCLMCGTVGVEPTKRVAKEKPKCFVCLEPFTRGRKRRLWRRRWVHVDCAEAKLIPRISKNLA